MIIPIHFLCEAKREEMRKLSSYLRIFLEGKEYHIERRASRFDKKSKSQVLQMYLYYYLHFYFVAIACSAAAIYKVIAEFNDSEKYGRIIMIIILTVVSFAIMIGVTNHLENATKYYTTQWTAVKEAEEAAQTAASQRTEETQHGNESGGRT